MSLAFKIFVAPNLLGLTGVASDCLTSKMGTTINFPWNKILVDLILMHTTFATPPLIFCIEDLSRECCQTANELIANFEIACRHKSVALYQCLV